MIIFRNENILFPKTLFKVVKNFYFIPAAFRLQADGFYDVVCKSPHWHTDRIFEIALYKMAARSTDIESGRPTKTDRNLLATKVEGKRDAINIKDAVKNDIKRWRGKKKKTGEKDGFD